MAYERYLNPVPPQLLTGNGTTDGKIVIAKAGLFKIRQSVVLRSSTQQPVELEIKDSVDTTLTIGPRDRNPDTRTDLSAFLTADNASIRAPKQLRPMIPLDHIIPEHDKDQWEHEEEPTNAKRVILVGRSGDPIDTDLNGSGQTALVVEATVSGVTIDYPTTATVFNPTATGGVELEIVFPNTTRKFSLRVRGKQAARIAYAAGETATNYFTLSPGSVLSEDGIQLTNTSIFVLTAADAVIEVVAWT